MLEKLLGLASVGSTLASVGLLHRVLSDIASIIMLAIISAFLICALSVGGFVLAFCGLVHFGVEPYLAGMSMGITFMLLDALLLTLAIVRIRRLRSTHLSHAKNNNDLPALVDAFISGFLSPQPRT